MNVSLKGNWKQTMSHSLTFCLCASIYIYIYIYIHTCVYIYIYIYIYICGVKVKRNSVVDFCLDSLWVFLCLPPLLPSFIFQSRDEPTWVELIRLAKACHDLPNMVF